MTKKTWPGRLPGKRASLRSRRWRSCRKSLTGLRRRWWKKGGSSSAISESSRSRVQVPEGAQPSHRRQGEGSRQTGRHLQGGPGDGGAGRQVEGSAEQEGVISAANRVCRSSVDLCRLGGPVVGMLPYDPKAAIPVQVEQSSASPDDAAGAWPDPVQGENKPPACSTNQAGFVPPGRVAPTLSWRSMALGLARNGEPGLVRIA